MPRVSVVLCSYNQAAFLASTIESVRAQTYQDWELIAVDNGSTDGSQDILRSYHDPRIRLFLNEDNACVGRRLNEGIAAAKGELISFLYSDDLYVPHKLEHQVAAFDGPARDCGLVYGKVQGLNVHTGRTWTHATLGASGDVLIRFLDTLGIAQVDMLSPMVRRELWLRYPFYEDVFAEGEMCYAKVALTARFHFLDEILVIMRDHGGNRGKALWKNQEMTLHSLRRLGEHPDFPEAARPALRRAGPRLWGRLAWVLARVGEDPRKIRQCVWRSIDRSGAAPSPRVLGALALSLLPGRVRNEVNRLGFRLRNRAENVNLVDGYGGASD
jgi:glycosyltransferase involved in cell wall biosynthesis